ncbi:hypothetical protein B0J11DRAFT_580886 [Dendryphion nanum]|uniref:Uncharacterized protein n=1 Tax=Dendryphion nanum TaxID=256645 RepID=A0A9P9IM00_9PLEO|nr:hypothetical protein B0J11DRAFT_580886 [Dendryphion nanum]
MQLSRSKSGHLMKTVSSEKQNFCSPFALSGSPFKPAYDPYNPSRIYPNLAYTNIPNYRHMSLFMGPDNVCHFLRLPLSIRSRIYKLVLDFDTPRKVFASFPEGWKKENLTEGEIIQHSAVLCSETQQWRCLHGYLYNPSRQLYQVANKEFEDLIEQYWGREELFKRAELYSIPWKFVQIAVLAEDYPISNPSNDIIAEDMDSSSINSLLYNEDYTLHEVFHSEIIEEVHRIQKIQQINIQEAHLYRLAAGVGKFLTEMVNMDAGMVEVHEWLGFWLRNPLGPFPRPLFRREVRG